MNRKIVERKTEKKGEQRERECKLMKLLLQERNRERI